MEKGLVNALSDRFPMSEERLCHFHFFKALFTNIQKKKLLPLYDIPEVRALLCCFGALALLPTNEIVAGYNQVCAELKKLMPSKIPLEFRRLLNDFCGYFCSTCIGTFKNGRLIRAWFNIYARNCFQRTLDGNPRTNNAVEGWHAHVNSLFPRAHMAMAQFLIRLQKEEEKIRNLHTRSEPNPAEGVRGRPSEVSKREHNLRVLVANYAKTPPE